MRTPIVLVTSDDELLLLRETDRRLEALRAEDSALDVLRHDVSELEHLPELRTTSLFGGRTCVVLRGAEGLTGALKDEVETYLESPSPDAVLLLAAKGVGRIPKIAKLAKEAGERVDVRTPAEWDGSGWERMVGEEFRRLGRKADATAIAAIREHAGTSPSAIASQVASVCATADGVPVLTADYVHDVVSGHGRASGFAVADAVARRDPLGAFTALKGALDAGEAPLALVGALTWKVRQLLLVRAGTSAKDAGIRSDRLYRQARTEASGFGPGELAWVHDRLARLDLELKGGELPDGVAIEIAVLELATSREVGSPFNPLALG